MYNRASLPTLPHIGGEGVGGGALCSFGRVYICGSGLFKLLKKINCMRFKNLEKRFLKWNMVIFSMKRVPPPPPRYPLGP